MKLYGSPQADQDTYRGLSDPEDLIRIVLMPAGIRELERRIEGLGREHGTHPDKLEKAYGRIY